LELPPKFLPSVEEFQEKLEKLNADQGGRLTLEKGDDPKDLRGALKAAAGPSTGGSGSRFAGRKGR
jgi:hypothetical protein